MMNRFSDARITEGNCEYDCRGKQTTRGFRVYCKRIDPKCKPGSLSPKTQTFSDEDLLALGIKNLDFFRARTPSQQRQIVRQWCLEKNLTRAGLIAFYKDIAPDEYDGDEIDQAMSAKETKNIPKLDDIIWDAGFRRKDKSGVEFSDWVGFYRAVKRGELT